jgi:hypothetical protein
LAENESLNSPANGTENPGGAPAAGAVQPPTRPDFIPEKYWDGTKGEPRVQDMAKGLSELEGRLSKGKETYKAEYEAERFKARPAKPEDYKLAMPKEGPLAERFGKANLVLLDQKPGEGFQPEQGKRYFVLDQKSPLLQHWRATAHAAGMSNDQFMEGVAAYAEDLIGRQPSAESVAAEISAEHKKLGEQGRDRAQFAYGRIKALLGDEAAKAFDFIQVDAAGTLAVEALLEKLGEPKFSPGAANTGAADPTAALAEAKKLMGDPDYWQNKEKQARVAEAYKKIYPGTVGPSLMPSHAA